MTSPSTIAPASREEKREPDLSYFRQHFPATVAHFGALPEREAWLRRLWQEDARWQRETETHGGRVRVDEEALVRGAPPAGLAVEAEFDIIYTCGAFGVLHAALMACRYGRRVLVFGEEAPGAAVASASSPQQSRNVSTEDLEEFERAGLLTKEEVEAAVVNRYERGFVKFHDAGSRVKAERLWMSGVLDVGVDANKLLATAAAKIRARTDEGSAVIDGLRFVRAYVEPHRVTVETRDRRGTRRLFAARLFVDSTSSQSPIARQLNASTPATHVRPTVGTIARGFLRGEEPGRADFRVGEILVSTEDASESRQLVWEGFAGSPARDEYATYLFFYDSVDSQADKSLLSLFERYFETLPAYKRTGAQWRVQRPLFGHVPAFQPQGLRRRVAARTADERVLLLGDAAGAASPLTLGSFGAQLRTLRRRAHLTDLALAADLLDAASLSEIGSEGTRVAQVAGLAEFLRPAPKSAPSTVNETLNAVMAALHTLDERVRRDLFQDRMTFSGLRSLLGHTAKLYPRIFGRVREHMGARGTFWWLADIAEAVWRERRRRGSSSNSSSGGGGNGDEPDALDEAREQTEEPARKFARYAALYKQGDGAGDR